MEEYRSDNEFFEEEAENNAVLPTLENSSNFKNKTSRKTTIPMPSYIETDVKEMTVLPDLKPKIKRISFKYEEQKGVEDVTNIPGKFKHKICLS